MKWECLYLRNQLAATFPASAFTLIGPYVCYIGVCTQAESVHQNCVLRRCVCLCLIKVLHLTSLFFFFELVFYGKIWIYMLKV